MVVLVIVICCDTLVLSLKMFLNKRQEGCIARAKEAAVLDANNNVMSALVSIFHISDDYHHLALAEIKEVDTKG
eukprot:8747864-Ditylum_brightwellii.AAC.1